MIGGAFRWLEVRIGGFADYLFAYDFFISYGQPDGTRYPTALHNQLEKQGYETFLDTEGFTAGADLPTATLRHIKMSRTLILLARPYALRNSDWVKKELEWFIAQGRTPIVIEFPKVTGLIAQDSPLADLFRNRLSIREDTDDIDGTPSPATIGKLIGSLAARRRETRRKGWIAGAMAALLTFSLVAAWQWYEADHQQLISDAGRLDARAATFFADANRMMTEWDAEATRQTSLRVDIDKASVDGDAAGDSAAGKAGRLANLKNELAESRATQGRLNDEARIARQYGSAELALADKEWKRVGSGAIATRQAPARPRVFSVEVLSVGFGESLIVHYGHPDAPSFIIIDGGQTQTFARSLKPRLDALRTRWAPDRPLRIDYVMVSNQDEDRSGGIERMLREAAEAKAGGNASTLNIANIWWDSFAPPGGRSPKGRISRHIEQLGIAHNKPFDHLVMRPANGRLSFDLGGGLIVTVLGPDAASLAQLHKWWSDQARRDNQPAVPYQEERFSRVPIVPVTAAGPTETGECKDRSIANRASLILLFEFAGRRFHPGDSCAHQIEAALRAAGLSDAEGRFSADLMLLPHLGSDNNVNPEFLRRVTAKQYLFTGNGKHGKPSKAILQMLLAARRAERTGGNPYTLLFINRDGERDHGERLDAFFAGSASEEFGYRRVFRSSMDSAAIVDLIDRVRY